MTLLLRPIWSKHLSHSCFIMFCTKSVWLSFVDYVKTQRWKLSKQQRAGGWQRGHSPTVDVKCICLCLTDCWCVCCSQQLLLFVVSLSWVLVFSQDVSIFLSLSLSNKKGRNHTRQELISQAANSHSRWSFFFFFFLPKWKDQMKALTLYVILGGTELMRLFSAPGVPLCLCISQLLFYFIYSSCDLHTSTSLSLHGAPLHRPVNSKPAAWSSSVWRVCSSGARFTHLIFIVFFLFLCMWDIFRKRQVFLLSGYSR